MSVVTRDLASAHAEVASPDQLMTGCIPSQLLKHLHMGIVPLLSPEKNLYHIKCFYHLMDHSSISEEITQGPQEDSPEI